MRWITLSEALEDHTQAEIAEALGVHQTYISQIARSTREVFVQVVTEMIDGKRTTVLTGEAYEKRPIGRTRGRATLTA